MRFWDSSALVPLLVTEPTSETVVALLYEDDEVTVWWGTWVECAVALSRLVREGRLDGEAEEETRILLNRLFDVWSGIQPTDEVRFSADVLSQRYPLKAADALQLAAALQWCEWETEGREFACLDDRLRRAAATEGFDVLPESEETREALP